MRGPRFNAIGRRRSGIELAFVANPRSLAIAAKLNRRGVTVCKHGRNPCTVFCGVGWFDGQWAPIEKRDRVAFVCNLLDDVTHQPRRHPSPVLHRGPEPARYFPLGLSTWSYRHGAPPRLEGYTPL